MKSTSKSLSKFSNAKILTLNIKDYLYKPLNISILPLKSILIFRQVFKLFDRNGDDTINPTNLKDALKALGQNPSQETVRNLISQVKFASNLIVM